VVKPLHIAAFTLAKIGYTYIRDREGFYKTCSELNQLRKDLKPEQACFLLGYFFGPGLTRLCTGKITRQIKQDILDSRFLKALNQQEQVQLAMSGVNNFNQNIQNTLQPIKMMLNKAVQTVNRAGKNIAKVGKSLVKGVQNFVYKNLTDEVFATFGTNLPRINLKHLFVGEFDKKNKLVGFHSTQDYPQKIIKITIPPDKNGVFKADFLHQGQVKNSSFFPKNWDQNKIMEKIKEAYCNIKELKNSGIVGETSEGIKITIWFVKLPTGEIIINSVYPKI
jgi:hypothetical protein